MKHPNGTCCCISFVSHSLSLSFSLSFIQSVSRFSELNGLVWFVMLPPQWTNQPLPNKNEREEIGLVFGLTQKFQTSFTSKRRTLYVQWFSIHHQTWKAPYTSILHHTLAPLNPLFFIFFPFLSVPITKYITHNSNIISHFILVCHVIHVV